MAKCITPANRRRPARKRAGEKAGRCRCSNDNLPYAVKLAAQKYPVTLYVTNCGEACDKAREHLAKRGVPHSTVDPQKPEGAEALKKAAGALEVPVLVVGSSVSKGYAASAWDAALDAAGYPKSSVLPKSAVKKPKPPPASLLKRHPRQPKNELWHVRHHVPDGFGGFYQDIVSCICPETSACSRVGNSLSI